MLIVFVIYLQSNCTLISGVFFCKRDVETFDHFFACNFGVFCPTSIQSTHLTSYSSENSLSKLKKIKKIPL